jgi:hypothetical protein
MEWPKTWAFFHPKWSITASASLAMIAVLQGVHTVSTQNHRPFDFSSRRQRFMEAVSPLSFPASNNNFS